MNTFGERPGGNRFSGSDSEQILELFSNLGFDKSEHFKPGNVKPSHVLDVFFKKSGSDLRKSYLFITKPNERRSWERVDTSPDSIKAQALEYMENSLNSLTRYYQDFNLPSNYSNPWPFNEKLQELRDQITATKQNKFLRVPFKVLVENFSNLVNSVEETVLLHQENLEGALVRQINNELNEDWSKCSDEVLEKKKEKIVKAMGELRAPSENIRDLVTKFSEEIEKQSYTNLLSKVQTHIDELTQANAKLEELVRRGYYSSESQEIKEVREKIEEYNKQLQIGMNLPQSLESKDKITKYLDGHARNLSQLKEKANNGLGESYYDEARKTKNLIDDAFSLQKKVSVFSGEIEKLNRKGNLKELTDEMKRTIDTGVQQIPGESSEKLLTQNLGWSWRWRSKSSKGEEDPKLNMDELKALKETVQTSINFGSLEKRLTEYKEAAEYLAAVDEALNKAEEYRKLIRQTEEQGYNNGDSRSLLQKLTETAERLTALANSEIPKKPNFVKLKNTLKDEIDRSERWDLKDPKQTLDRLSDINKSNHTKLEKALEEAQNYLNNNEVLQNVENQISGLSNKNYSVTIVNEVKNSLQNTINQVRNALDARPRTTNNELDRLRGQLSNEVKAGSKKIEGLSKEIESLKPAEKRLKETLDEAKKYTNKENKESTSYLLNDEKLRDLYGKILKLKKENKTEAQKLLVKIVSSLYAAIESSQNALEGKEPVTTQDLSKLQGNLNKEISSFKTGMIAVERMVEYLEAKEVVQNQIDTYRESLNNMAKGDKVYIERTNAKDSLNELRKELESLDESIRLAESAVKHVERHPERLVALKNTVQQLTTDFFEKIKPIDTKFKETVTNEKIKESKGDTGVNLYKEARELIHDQYSVDFYDKAREKISEFQYPNLKEKLISTLDESPFLKLTKTYESVTEGNVNDFNKLQAAVGDYKSNAIRVAFAFTVLRDGDLMFAMKNCMDRLTDIMKGERLDPVAFLGEDFNAYEKLYDELKDTTREGSHFLPNSLGRVTESFLTLMSKMDQHFTKLTETKKEMLEECLVESGTLNLKLSDALKAAKDSPHIDPTRKEEIQKEGEEIKKRIESELVKLSEYASTCTLSQLNNERFTFRFIKDSLVEPLINKITYLETKSKVKQGYEDYLERLEGYKKKESQKSKPNKDILDVVGEIENKVKAAIEYIDTQESTRRMGSFTSMLASMKLYLNKTSKELLVLNQELDQVKKGGRRMSVNLSLQKDLEEKDILPIAIVKTVGSFIGNTIGGAIVTPIGTLGKKILGHEVRSIDEIIRQSFPEHIESEAKSTENVFDPTREIVRKIRFMRNESFTFSDKDTDKDKKLPAFTMEDIEKVLPKLTVEELEVLKTRLETYKDQAVEEKEAKTKVSTTEEEYQGYTALINSLDGKIEEYLEITKEMEPIHDLLKRGYDKDELEKARNDQTVSSEDLKAYEEIYKEISRIKGELEIYLNHKDFPHFQLIGTNVTQESEHTGISEKTLFNWKLHQLLSPYSFDDSNENIQHSQMLKKDKVTLTEEETRIFSLILAVDDTAPGALFSLPEEQIKRLEEDLIDRFKFNSTDSISDLKEKVLSEARKASVFLHQGVPDLVAKSKEKLTKVAEELTDRLERLEKKISQVDLEKSTLSEIERLTKLEKETVSEDDLVAIRTQKTIAENKLLEIREQRELAQEDILAIKRLKKGIRSSTHQIDREIKKTTREEVIDGKTVKIPGSFDYKKIKDQLSNLEQEIGKNEVYFNIKSIHKGLTRQFEALDKKLVENEIEENDIQQSKTLNTLREGLRSEVKKVGSYLEPRKVEDQDGNIRLVDAKKFMGPLLRDEKGEALKDEKGETSSGLQKNAETYSKNFEKTLALLEKEIVLQKEAKKAAREQLENLIKNELQPILSQHGELQALANRSTQLGSNQEKKVEDLINEAEGEILNSIKTVQDALNKRNPSYTINELNSIYHNAFGQAQAVKQGIIPVIKARIEFLELKGQAVKEINSAYETLKRQREGYSEELKESRKDILPLCDEIEYELKRLEALVTKEVPEGSDYVDLKNTMDEAFRKTFARIDVLHEKLHYEEVTARIVKSINTLSSRHQTIFEPLKDYIDVMDESGIKGKFEQFRTDLNEKLDQVVKISDNLPIRSNNLDELKDQIKTIDGRYQEISRIGIEIKEISNNMDRQLKDVVIPHYTKEISNFVKNLETDINYLGVTDPSNLPFLQKTNLNMDLQALKEKFESIQVAPNTVNDLSLPEITQRVQVKKELTAIYNNLHAKVDYLKTKDRVSKEINRAFDTLNRQKETYSEELKQSRKELLPLCDKIEKTLRDLEAIVTEDVSIDIDFVEKKKLIEDAFRDAFETKGEKVGSLDILYEQLRYEEVSARIVKSINQVVAKQIEINDQLTALIDVIDDQEVKNKLEQIKTDVRNQAFKVTEISEALPPRSEDLNELKAQVKHIDERHKAVEQVSKDIDQTFGAMDQQLKEAIIPAYNQKVMNDFINPLENEVKFISQETKYSSIRDEYVAGLLNLKAQAEGLLAPNDIKISDLVQKIQSQQREISDLTDVQKEFSREAKKALVDAIETDIEAIAIECDRRGFYDSKLVDLKAQCEQAIEAIKGTDNFKDAFERLGAFEEVKRNYEGEYRDQLQLLEDDFVNSDNFIPNIENDFRNYLIDQNIAEVIEGRDGNEQFRLKEIRDDHIRESVTQWFEEAKKLKEAFKFNHDETNMEVNVGDVTLDHILAAKTLRLNSLKIQQDIEFKVTYNSLVGGPKGTEQGRAFRALERELNQLHAQSEGIFGKGRLVPAETRRRALEKERALRSYLDVVRNAKSVEELNEAIKTAPSPDIFRGTNIQRGIERLQGVAQENHIDEVEQKIRDLKALSNQYLEEHFPFVGELKTLKEGLNTYATNKTGQLSFVNKKEMTELQKAISTLESDFQNSLNKYDFVQNRRDYFERFMEIRTQFSNVQQKQSVFENKVDSSVGIDPAYRPFIDFSESYDGDRILAEINKEHDQLNEYRQNNRRFFTPEQDQKLDNCVKDLNALRAIQPETAGFKDFAGLALIQKRILEVKLEIQTQKIRDTRNSNTPRNSIYRTSSYKDLAGYLRDLQSELNAQKRQGKVTQFSTTQKIFDAVKSCLNKINAPEQYEDIFNAPQQLKTEIEALQKQGALSDELTSRAMGLVNNFVNTVEVIGKAEAKNKVDPLRKVLDEKKALTSELQDTKQVINGFFGLSRKENEKQLLEKMETKIVEDSKVEIRKGQEWKGLDEKRTSLQTRIVKDKEEGQRLQDTEAKIEAISSTMAGINGAMTLEEISHVTEDLNNNPMIDIGNRDRFGGDFLPQPDTDTRKLVDPFVKFVKETIDKNSNLSESIPDFLRSEIKNTNEWKELEKKLASLEKELPKFDLKTQLTKYQDTEKKITALKTFFKEIEKAKTLEDIIASVDKLNASTDIDINRGNEVRLITESREQVDGMTKHARKIFNSKIPEELQVWGRVSDRGEQLFDLFDKDKRESLLCIPEDLPSSTQKALKDLRQNIFDNVDRLMDEAKGSELSEEFGAIFEDIENFDKAVIQARKEFFTAKNEEELTERSVFERGVRGFVGIAKNIGHLIESVKLSDIAGKIKLIGQGEPEPFIKEEWDTPKKVFEGNLERLIDQKAKKGERFIDEPDQIWLKENYDNLYKSVEESIFGTDHENPGFVELLRREAQHFINRKIEYMGGGEDFVRQTDEHIAQLEAAIEAIENMSDKQKEALINVAMISRLERWKEEDGRVQTNDGAFMKDPSFYSAFCFKEKLFDVNGKKESLQRISNDVGMAPNDPDNVLKVQLSEDSKEFLPMAVGAMALCGAYGGSLLADPLKNAILKQIPQTKTVATLAGPVIGAMTGASLTTIAYQKLRQGFEIPRNGALWPFRKGLGEWFIENNGQLSQGLEQYKDMTSSMLLGYQKQDLSREEQFLYNTEEGLEERVGQQPEEIPERFRVNSVLKDGKAKFAKSIEGFNENDKQWLLDNYESLHNTLGKQISGKSGRERGFKEHVEGTLDHFKQSQKQYLDQVTPAEKEAFLSDIKKCKDFSDDFFESFEGPEKAGKRTELINQALLARALECRKKSIPLDMDSVCDKPSQFRWLYQNVQGKGNKTFEEAMSEVNMLSSNPKNQKQSPKYPIWLAPAVIFGSVIVLAAVVAVTWWLVALPIGLLAGVVGAVGLLGTGFALRDKISSALAELKTKILGLTLSDYFKESVKTLSDELVKEKEALAKIEEGLDKNVQNKEVKKEEDLIGNVLIEHEDEKLIDQNIQEVDIQQNKGDVDQNLENKNEGFQPENRKKIGFFEHDDLVENEEKKEEKGPSYGENSVDSKKSTNPFDDDKVEKSNNPFDDEDEEKNQHLKPPFGGSN